MSNSMRPRRWKPTRLLRPWDSPGKNTGVGAIAFSLLCYVPFIPTFLRVFTVDVYLDYVKCFPFICWYDLVIFILCFGDHIDWFVNIKPSLHFWDKPYLITVYVPFNVLLKQACNILLVIFALLLICDISL